MRCTILSTLNMIKLPHHLWTKDKILWFSSLTKWQLTVTWQTSHSNRINKLARHIPVALESSQYFDQNIYNYSCLPLYVLKGRWQISQDLPVNILTKTQPAGMQRILQVIITETASAAKSLWGKEREARGLCLERTYTDTSSIHPHGQPPGLWVKGHTGARSWRHKHIQE